MGGARRSGGSRGETRTVVGPNPPAGAFWSATPFQSSAVEPNQNRFVSSKQRSARSGARLTILEYLVPPPVQRERAVLGKLETEEDGEDREDGSCVESGGEEVAVLFSPTS